MIARLHARLAERLAPLGLVPDDVLGRDAPGGLAQPGIASANRHCRLFEAADDWVALNLAREDDRELIPALTGEADGDVWANVAHTARAMPASALRDRAIEMQMPVAIPGECPPVPLPAAGRLYGVPRRVLDMSALWAGPLCAGLLARAGAEVVRIESIGRPDPTPLGSPALDAWINGAKRRLPLDLRTTEGRVALNEELDRCDVVVTSARGAALARLGIDRERLRHATWVAITAHGMDGQGANRVGFGDDCAVAGGLIAWSEDKPQFMGDALADPLTGVEAALAVLGGQRGVIDMAMARIASGYALELQ